MAQNIKGNPSSSHEAANVLQVALPPELVTYIDRHRHAQTLKPSREETVVAVLRAWAGGQDYWKEIQRPAEGLRPEQLNATNDD